MAACATPIAPTGGPDDTTAPTLAASAPEAGSVRVEADEDGGLDVVLTFSERLDPQSAGAVQLTPAGDTPPTSEIRGREVRVRLDSLREQTTYVITVTTDLRDARRVPLESPVTVAFATGDRLDQGRIVGRVRGPEAGAGASGVAVWAYAVADAAALDDPAALPDPRQRPPDYQTETGSDGSFALDYLREGAFFVAAVRDANRNRRADPGEAFAAPPEPLALADSLGGTPLVLTLGRVDSLAPEPQRARGLSDRRLAVRFSERVRLATVDTDPWVVSDSARGERVPVSASYVDPISPQEVRLQMPRPLAEGAWRVALNRAGVVTDSAGNGVAPFDVTVQVPARPDTAQARFAGFLPESRVPADSAVVLRPDQQAGVAFTIPFGALPPLTVTAASGDTLSPDPFAPNAREVLLRLPPEARRFTVSLADGDSTRQRRYRRPGPRETGEIIGRVTGADSAAVIVEAVPEAGNPLRTTAGADGRFRLAGLPPGPYRLRFVLDADGDGAWSPGRLAPYGPPERLVFAGEPQTVRARFETDVGELDLAEGGPAPEASGEDAVEELGAPEDDG